MIVVGAGVAGLSAALEAAQGGMRVLVLEASDTLGGTAQTAGGGTWVADSPFQRSQGIEDSIDSALREWAAWGGPSVDAGWAERYVTEGATAVFGFLSSLGVTWEGVRAHEGNGVPRWHAPRGGGYAVMRALEDRIRAVPQVECRLHTRVRGVTVEAGRATGVIISGSGADREVRADAVVMATGGFNNNRDMVQRALGSDAPPDDMPSQVLLGGGAGARGEGHNILRGLGAEFVNLDVLWMYPYATPDPRSPGRGLVIRGIDADVWVNRDGSRFHDESRRGGASGTPALRRQPCGTCWSIVDARMAAKMIVADPQYRTANVPNRVEIDRLLRQSPYVAQAESLDALADLIGVDRSRLVSTIRRQNELRATGVRRDPDYDRPLTGLAPIEEPPFFAIQFFPLSRKNLGGVQTDGACHVQFANGSTISGLFAVGELAGMAGGHINGTAALEGTMFGPSLLSGRVAGRFLATGGTRLGA